MSFIDDGYEVVTLSREGAILVERVRHMVYWNRGHLKAQKIARYVRSSDDHVAWQKVCADRINAFNFSRVMAMYELDTLRDFVGSEIMYQRHAYFRAARPHVPGDNIGFHRDTWYGDSPLEVSMVVPLTQMTEGAAFKVSPGSHIEPEDSFPTMQTDDPLTPKGGTKHSLGFLYAPKKLVTPVPMHSVEVCVGQALLFPVSLLHGQEVNTASWMRMSVDFKVAPSNVGLSSRRSVNEYYYQPLCESLVWKVKRLYDRENGK